MRRGLLQILDGPQIANPNALFAGGKAGAWFNFSSNALLFTTSTGTTNVAADGLIGSVVGSRAADPFGTGLGPEEVVNGTFDTDLTGWTESAAAGYSQAVSSGELVGSSTATTGAGGRYQNITTAAGYLYRLGVLARKISGTATAFMRISQGASVTGDGTSIDTSTTSLSAQQLSMNWVATGTAITQYLRYTSTANPSSVGHDNASAKLVPGFAARQGTSSLRPAWRSARSGYADFDGSDDVLVATFPSAFTGDVVYLTPDGSVVELFGQSITTSYSLPGVDMKHCVIRVTMTAGERNALKKWMRRQPLS